MRDWPLDVQATAYRGMVFAQTQEENVLMGVASLKGVNGRFTLDFLQTFSSPVFVNAFLKELEENGIVYDLQDVNELELPNIKLPWTE